MTNTLIAKIAAASLAVGALATDKVNASQNYKYISADKILERAGDALAQAGVMVIPSITHEETAQMDYTDKYGKAMTRFDAVVHFAMLIADGESQLEIPWRGRGNDFAVPDKALYKAITSGHKYFLMKLLNIGVGNEDGEHDDGQAAQDATPAAKSGKAAPAENPFEEQAKPLVSTEQTQKIARLGALAYPTDWDDNKDRLAQWASQGARMTLGELYELEAQNLIRALERKVDALKPEKATA